MHAKQMQALDLIPEIAGEFSQAFGRGSGGLIRATAARTPRRSSSRSARCSARSRRSSTSCASRGQDRGGRRQVLPPVPARGGSRGAGARRAGRGAREGARGRHRRHRRPERAAGALRAPPPRSTTSSPAWGAADHEGVAADLSTTSSRTASSRTAHVPRHGLGARRARARAHARSAAPARTPRTSCATSGPSRARHRTEEDESVPHQQIKFYQVGSFVAGNRLLDPSSARSRRAWSARTRSPPATAPARAAARRSALATRSTRPCARPRGS